MYFPMTFKPRQYDHRGSKQMEAMEVSPEKKHVYLAESLPILQVPIGLI